LIGRREDILVRRNDSGLISIFTRCLGRTCAACSTSGLLAAAFISIAADIPAAVAAPATDHPRLWFNSTDVPRLQGWAVSTNPMFQNGLVVAANAALADVNAKWNWTTGLPNSSWNDAGGVNWEGEATEAYAEFFAFMSLVDPNVSMRPQWAMRARTLLMYVMNRAVLGPAANVPFRDPGFITGNRANYWGEAWGLTVDWIYGSLSASDKATIRTVFMMWANQIYTVPNRAGQSPLLPGSLNDPRVLGNDPTQTAFTQQNDQLQLRWAANNYFIGQMRTLSLMAMAFDPADDPVNGSGVGSSLRSYIPDVLGWWLYQVYAVFENAATVHAELGITAPNMSLGIASGGLPVEGTLYGESLGFLAQALLGLETAGFADPTTYGPQAGFFASPYWDNVVNGFLHLIAPTPYVPSVSSGYSYLGQVWPIATYGDTLRTWITPDFMDMIGPVGLYDFTTNNQPRLAKARWISTNVLEGGSAKFYSRAANIWGNSYATQSILYFMLFDPAATIATDPRPSLPVQITAPAIGTILARTDWSANATWFTTRCSWEWINHESGDCGQFTLYRKGQWLTKEWSNYADDWMGYTPLYHNTMSLKNRQVPISPSIWDTTMQYGGQWNNGGSFGDPSVTLSANDNWSYALFNMANLYNHPDWWTAARNAKDVTIAARSVVWLNPDYVVVYDRADSAQPNEFKRFNLVLMNAPTIAGQTANIVANGQALSVQVVMPPTATIREQHFWTTDPSQEVNAVSALDTSYDRLIIEDPSNPMSLRLLTVLQGTDAGVAADAASPIHSVAGAAFDGVTIKNTAVVFPSSIARPATATTYAVPATVTRHLVTGLAPGGGYDVTLSTAANVTTVSVTPGSMYTADVGGVIGIGFPPPSNPTQGGVVAGQKLQPPPGGIGSATAAIVHDFNGDALSDIAWRDGSGDVVSWLMSSMLATSSGALGNVPTSWSIVGQRDFDGDGTTDLLWRDSSGNTAIWFMNGTVIAASASVGNVPTAWSVIATGDFNGDGKGDILWRDSSSNLAVWLMNGAAVVSSGLLGHVPSTWSVVGTGDFNGDGTSDLLWRDSSGDTAIWFMKGVQVSSSEGVGTIPTSWSVVGTGDFNGDNRSDIVWRDTGGNTSIWLMNGAAVLSAGGLGNLPTTWSIVEVGDYNGDGMSDLVWRDSSGNTAIWFMNGTAIAFTGGVGNIPTAWTVQSVNAE
jgi:FG-GAP-like repeat